MREIDLSLDRIRQVFMRLLPQGVGFTVISVAGTNGKGSTSELLRSIYHEAGYRVGKYTSPHIFAFNERINVNGLSVSDSDLLAAFEAVEVARGATRLTYFEYATLVALHLFMKFEIDIAVMEVGLGGRLDATNVLDADLAIVTSISMDHTAWLGDTLEKIGREKIGIARAGRHCVLGMSEPTQSILNHCAELNVEPYIYGQQFKAKINREGQSLGSHSAQSWSWSWQGQGREILGISLPFQQRSHQINNAATAIQSVVLLQSSLPVPDSAIKQGIATAVNLGRCQLVNQSPWVILDVAHNVDAVTGLRNYIKQLPVKGKVYGVCGMLHDKQISEILALLTQIIDEWHFATIDNARGSKAIDLENALRLLQTPTNTDDRHNFHSYCHESAIQAYRQVRAKLTNDDCLIVFGSFFMVSDIIAEIRDQPQAQ